MFASFNPINLKLLNNDIFNYENGTIRLVSSSNRSSSIAGVIIISKTYGMYKEKFLYKCIHMTTICRSFLYHIRFPIISQKNLTPVYVSFKFKSWEDKHPRGEIVKTIGPTDIL